LKDNDKALSHIDDRYGVDVDELHDIKDILPAATKEKYQIQITAGATTTDVCHLAISN
jgi:hypothetical protein